MNRVVAGEEKLIDLHFPRAGVDLSMGYEKQPNRPSEDHGYVRTCPLGDNVRGYEAATNRARGGNRAGLAKYLAARPGGVEFVTQELALLVGEGYDPPGGTMQLSNSGRVVTLVAVSQGNVYTTTPGGTAWTAALNSTGLTPPLNYSGLVYSAANNQKLYFADGTNYVYYDPSVNTMYPWVASAGSLPRDSDNNAPRLIQTWRGRTVVSGLQEDPHNWFMSAGSDPTDWDYSPASVAPDQAIAGNNSSLGLIGDVVTTLIPYTDDILVFGGDHTIYMMRGDPMAGGQIDLISDAIGMAWGIPWTKDPAGNIYFVSNKTGIYTLIPGQQPQRISQAIEQLLQLIDTGTQTIRLLWDDRFQGLHVFVTPLAAPGAATHYFYEQRSGAWWTDSFTNTNHNPLCCCTLDGNQPGDRVPLVGSWDGYVRWIDPDATTDDGTAISSSVVIGPLLTKDLDELMLKDLQGVLGTASGSVTFSVYAGSSAEAALASTPAVTGTWAAGRNLDSHVRRAGHAIYVKLSSTSAWAMEVIRARVAGLGKVRQRGR